MAKMKASARITIWAMAALAVLGIIGLLADSQARGFGANDILGIVAWEVVVGGIALFVKLSKKSYIEQ